MEWKHTWDTTSANVIHEIASLTIETIPWKTTSLPLLEVTGLRPLLENFDLA